MIETEYKAILAALQENLDRPARLDRFQSFQKAVHQYTTETKTLWPKQGHGVFLIAGTNGKGSVAKTLETLLAAAGERVGLFTSPHLMDTTERIRTGGHDLSHREFVDIYRFIEPFITEHDLSHFEVLTLMMIETFFGGRSRPRVAKAVIEVGVGGRLDPTRVVPHEFAVITKIGLDHEAILGPLAMIAREKFAITEGSRVAIFARPEKPEVTAALNLAKSRDSETLFIEAPTYSHRVVSGLAGDKTPRWIIETSYGEAQLSLPGERAVFNTSVALEVLKQAGYDVAALLPALANVQWPARMEKMEYRGRSVYLSGDHNPQGIDSLRSLLTHFNFENLWLVVGIGKNKPLGPMLELYAAFPRVRIILTTTSFRSLKPEDYGVWANQTEGVVTDSLEALDQAVSSAGPDDLIVVSGSLYLVGDLRARILSQNQSGGSVR